MKFIKQYNLGKWPGLFLFLYGNASGVIGIGLSFINASTFYVVVVDKYLPGLPYWAFFSGLIAFYLLMMILVYVFITPSIVAVSNWQGYEHENPIRKDLKEISERIKRIEKALKIDK